jgi:hypothetical protein
MKHEISVADEIVLVIMSGGISPEDYGHLAKSIVDLPEWRPTMKLLIDYSRIDFSGETGTNADLYAQAIIPYKSRLGDGRLACVNTNPADYGLGRMWQVFMEAYTNLQVGIFYTFEDALIWLNEPEEDR